jgi:hypothetical protein
MKSTWPKLPRQTGGCKKGCVNFEARLRPIRQMILAMQRLGFDWQQVLNMPEQEAFSYLGAFNAPGSTSKAKTYLVKQNKDN